jgi:hypothetical protein
MLNKTVLLNAISKYHLAGAVERVKWNVENKTLKVSFINDSQNLVGEVECKGIIVEDGTYGIFDTNGLTKMISVLDQEILIDVVKEGTIPSKLTIADTHVDLKYNLADPQVIPKTPNITGINDKAFTFELTAEFISKFIRAKDALGEDVFFISTQDGFANKEAVISVGRKSSNTITFRQDISISEDISTPIPFNADLFKEVLRANRTASSGKVSLNPKGLLIVEFETDETTSKYYLVRNQNSN